MARPSEFSGEIGTEICARIREGESLKSIVQDQHMPSERTVYYWLENPSNEAFLQQYARAREVQGDASADEIVLTAKKVERGQLTSDQARVIIDAHKWNASRRAPKKYGDKTFSESEVNLTARTIQDKPLTSEEWEATYGTDLPKPNGHMNGHANGQGNGKA